MVLLFACGALLPAGLVVYAQYPDWALMYLADPARLSAWLMVPLVMVLYVGSAVAGFLATHHVLVGGSERDLKILLGSCGALALVVVGFGWRRLLTVAYYDDFHHGGAQVPLYGSPLLAALVVIIFFVAFGFIFSVLQVWRHVEALRSVQTPQPAAAAVEVTDTLDEVLEPQPQSPEILP